MADEDRKLPTLVSGAAVRAIVPQDFDGAWRIANAVCVAGMAPKELSSPERCTIAILHGLEVGLPPMAALQSIAVINGRPTVWGDGALALVQGSGKLETIKETVEGDGDKRVAICRVMRKGDPEPKIARFSVADARLANLWGRKGPWTEYPGRMLQMRARAFALRDAFADVLRGLGIAEEVRDTADREPVVNVPQPPRPPVKAIIEEKKERVSPLTPTPQIPPRPPVKGPEPEEPEDEPGFDEPLDGQEETRPRPGTLLTELEKALKAATTAEDIEQVWNEHDLMAVLEGVPNGAGFQAVAMSLKREHLARVEGRD